MLHSAVDDPLQAIYAKPAMTISPTPARGAPMRCFMKCSSRRSISDERLQARWKHVTCLFDGCLIELLPHLMAI